MKQTRRRILGQAAGLAAAGAMAACSQGGSQSATVAPIDNKAKYDISFWARNATDKQSFDAMMPMAKEQFPNLSVDVQIPAGTLIEKLNVAVAADTPPDGVVMGLGEIKHQVYQKVVRSLQDYLKRDKQAETNLKGFAPATVQTYTIDNQLYAIPATNEGIVLWYNKDAFADARLPFPRDIEDDPNKWNWNTIVEMARTLNRGSGTDRQRYGLMVTGRKTNAAISESWGNIVYANDGRFLNDQGTKWTLNSQQGLATMQWIVDLQTRYGVHPEVDYYLQQNVLDRDLFIQGRLAMLPQGEFLSRYLYGGAKPAGGVTFNYDVAQLPFGAGKKKRAAVYNGNGLVMVRGTKQPDGIWQWLHVNTFKEAQQQITNLWGSRGAHTGTYQTWLTNGGGGGPVGLNYQAIVKTSDYAISYPVSPYLGQNDLITPCTTILYDQVFVRKMTPADGLKQMETDINNNLANAGAH